MKWASFLRTGFSRQEWTGKFFRYFREVHLPKDILWSHCGGMQKSATTASQRAVAEIMHQRPESPGELF